MDMQCKHGEHRYATYVWSKTKDSQSYVAKKYVCMNPHCHYVQEVPFQEVSL